MFSSASSVGVNASRTSPQGAKPETINDTGAVTARSPSALSHTVRMDIESLPTGIVIPKAGQKSMPMASTVS